MILVIGGVQATVRIDMVMPQKPEPGDGTQEISPWEREAYGEGGRFGSMSGIPSGDPSKDRITVFYSGCGYSVAKALAEDGRDVAFLSLIGEDPLGLGAREDLKRSGVDTRHLLAKEDTDKQTSVKIIARNFLGDTEFWRADERIQEEMTPERLKEKEEVIAGADTVFVDGSLPEETLKWIGEICRRAGNDLYFDPASMEGSARGAGALEYFTGILPGRREAEVLSDLTILSPDQLKEAGEYFAGKGVRRVVITMKGGGLYWREGDEEGILRPERILQFGETAGAGDVVSAAFLKAFAEEEPMTEAAPKAMAAAADHLSGVSDERRY